MPHSEHGLEIHLSLLQLLHATSGAWGNEGEEENKVGLWERERNEELGFKGN